MKTIKDFQLNPETLDQTNADTSQANMNRVRWSELQSELLATISQKLGTVLNFKSFGEVCRSWRSVTLEKYFLGAFLNKHPLLMLSSDEDECSRRFFSIMGDMLLCLHLPQSLECHCWGSQYGRLITVGYDQMVYLLDPFTSSRVPFPPLSAFDDPIMIDQKPGFNRMCCIKKAMIFCVPSSSPAIYDEKMRFMVFLIYSEARKAAFSSPGDECWTALQTPSGIHDILCFSGVFYAVDFQGSVWRINVSEGSDHARTRIFPPVEDAEMGDRFYLVEVSGALHLVVRIMHSEVHTSPLEFPHGVKTLGFLVFKVNFSSAKLEENKTLGNYSLLLGNNTSFSILASDHPGCRADCIYFTDDHEVYGGLLGKDTGIYILGKDSCEELYRGNEQFSRCSPPVWILANRM